ncbi:MAG: hypothetical protein LC742_08955 [Acidobacteria bacterium]|nr:hypothetical protein [Acidobacteriota bacterium]
MTRNKLASSSSALFRRAFLLGALTVQLFMNTHAQTAPRGKAIMPAAPTPALKRTTTRHEVRRFGYGGTLTIYGAPEGSVTIEAWPRSEIDLTADIEWRADTEEELTQLAAVNNFLIDESNTQFNVITTGTHDRKFMKRATKNFPKKLLATPWKIDYRLRVPAALDIDLFAGKGPIRIGGVEGAIRISAGEAPTTLVMTGGDLTATVAGGPVTLRVPARNWRGRGATVRLLKGDLTIELPPDFNADIDATVLRSGCVENLHPSLTPRERTTPTERALQARVGGGGPTLSFEVGDGTIRIKTVTSDRTTVMSDK